MLRIHDQWKDWLQKGNNSRKAFFKWLKFILINLKNSKENKKLSTVLWILNIPSQMPFIGFILQEHEESKFWISSLMYYVRWRVFFHILLCLSYKQLIGEERPGKNTSSGCQHNALKYIYSQSLKLLKNYLHYSCPFAWFHSLGKRTLLK